MRAPTRSASAASAAASAFVNAGSVCTATSRGFAVVTNLTDAGPSEGGYQRCAVQPGSEWFAGESTMPAPRASSGFAAVSRSPTPVAGPRSGAMRQEVGKPRLKSPTVGFERRFTRVLI